MPPSIPQRGDTRKISNHRRAGCHTEIAVSTLAPLPPAGPVMRGPGSGGGNRALGILLDETQAGRPVHVEHIPARPGREAPWPSWVPAEVTGAFAARGIQAPWSHEAQAADHAQAGRNVIISTAAASGKALGYLMPALTSVLAGDTVLYVTPTKALAADQLASIRALGLPGVQAATFDGDSTYAERAWARSHARYLLTTPDMLHRALLPGHARWSGFFSRLRYVVIDECHGYRGVFGSHVAHVLRRLQRVAAHYGASPVVVLASAAGSEPETMARRLVAGDVVAVTDDASPRSGLDFAFWEPPFTELVGEHGAPVRRSATSEAAELLADLVAEGVRTVAFVRSRRSAETVALGARRALDEVDPSLPRLVAAYRAGYLAEERRELERALHTGELVGLASTNALELGVDVSGLDAVLVTGWPGTRASMWQQVGRAGRARQQALAVFVARDDPLDTYVVTHPESLFGQPVEATVLDPDNPHVLGPHLCAAAAEIPLTDNNIDFSGPATPEVLADLPRRGLLRHRPAGWFWTKSERATDLGDLRGPGEPPVRIVEDGTGRLLGTVDAAAAHSTVHAGGVYLHQGVAHVVQDFLVDDGVALVTRRDPGWSTTARELTDIRIVE